MSCIQIKPGMRVRVVSVHHPCFARDIGKIEVVVRISSDGRQAWCKPIRLFPRKTRKGIVMKGANWETLRSVESIEPYFDALPESAAL